MSSTNGTVSAMHASGRSKREIYDWAESGQRGRLVWLPKEMLHVDHTYQRKSISNTRVNEIASNWNWAALMVIGVCQRLDGTYWVYDGQHRVLASLKRDDIKELPCIVFNSAGIANEADTFVVTNTGRGAMRRLDKFNAQLVAGDKMALAVQELVESCDYRISGGGGGVGSIACVEALERGVRTDYKTAQVSFLMCATVANRHQFSAKLFNAVFYLEQHLQKHDLSINVSNIREKLHSTDAAGLLAAIEESERYHRRNGARIGAQGLVQFINKGRRTRHIPSILV